MAYLICISAFVLCYLAPGILVRLASREKYEQRIGLSVLLVEGAVLSFWLVLLPCLLFARFGMLSQPVALAFILLVISVGAISIFRTDNLAVFKHPWGLFACLLVVLFHGYEVYSTPAVRGGFFYLSEIKDIVVAGTAPEAVYHFGEAIVPQLDKLGFDYTGTLYFLLGAGDYPIELKQVGYLGFTFLSALAVMLFFSRFVSPMLAATAALAVFANVFLSIAPTLRNFFIPESTALFFCFAAWFSILRLENADEPKWPLNMAGLSLAAAALSHLEIGFIAALGTAIILGLLSITKREGTLFRQLIYLGFFSAIFFGGSYAVIGSYPAFLDSSVESTEFFDSDNIDVTWEYFKASDLRYEKVDTPSRRLVGDVIAKAIFDSALVFHRPNSILVCTFILLFSLILSVETLRRRKVELYTTSVLGISSVLAIVVLLSIAILSEAYLGPWVYRTEATRRIAPYISIFLVTLLFAGLEQFLSMFRSNMLRTALSTFALAPIVMLSVVSLKYIAPIKTPFPVTEDGLNVLSWLRDNTTNNSIVVSNIATNGSFHVLADRTHLLEGHQPMLRPSLVKKTNNLLKDARRFFRAPKQHSSFLTDHSVSYVVSSDVADFGGSLAAEGLSRKQIPTFLCKEYSRGTIDVYRYCP